ncbi:MAG: hypothetical protein ACO36I_12705 [Candidatus Latescibacterota bacterium]
MQRFWFVIAFVTILATSSWSATLSGRLTSSAYSWQAREASGSDVRHLRLYQVAALNIGQVGGQALSLHTHFQFSGDMQDEINGREHYRIYSAYAKWAKQRWDVRLGRQRIFGGVGFGTIDGGRVAAQATDWLQVVGYGGMLTPVMPDDGIGTWDEGHLWGGQALVDIQNTYLTISYAERSREPLAYLGAGRYSHVSIAGSTTQYRRLGVDARHDWAQGSLYGRVDVDANAWEVQEFEVTGEAQVSDALTLAAEFEHRKPTLYLNSILSVFEVQDNQEAEARATFKINDQTKVLVRGSRSFYDGDSAWHWGAGLILKGAYLGYTRRVGYSGDNDSFTASIQHPINALWTVHADGSVASYRLYDAQVSRDRAWAGSFGARYQAKKTLSVDVEAQVLNNAFYNRDARVFVRGSYWFFKR